MSKVWKKILKGVYLLLKGAGAENWAQRNLPKMLWPLLLSTLLIGCASSGVVIPTTNVTPTPDLGGVLRIGTSRGWAHACPISPRLAITSAHVVDWFPEYGLEPVGGRWSDGWTGRGWFQTVACEHMFRDIAIIQNAPDETFSKWFPVAPKPPFEGEPLWVLGYNRASEENAFADLNHRVHFLREHGGRMVLRRNSTLDRTLPGPGSSGGCVLNAKGELVGILEATWFLEDEGKVGSAVSVWGETFEQK